ncbi:hypothetical protein Acsp03_39240 [Actinomadura sp. NBRC 104412]|nr:hypothetical protein Acsp03_39240 [Actinomadura sp. NBRC 104412]
MEGHPGQGAEGHPARRDSRAEAEARILLEDPTPVEAEGCSSVTSFQVQLAPLMLL